MDKAKKQYLEQRGWKIGSVADFLKLTAEEQEYIELKLALARKVREHRQKHKLTQTEAARLLKSSQSRVAKMEAGDPSVSLDLLIRSLIVLGASRQDLARVIAAPKH
jgi:predicted XRE-type DNA-binding protein